MLATLCALCGTKMYATLLEENYERVLKGNPTDKGLAMQD